MSISDIRILPPLAIARLGSAPEPLANYDLVIDPEDPLGYRRLVPAETFQVDRSSGEITGTVVPGEVRFKDAGDRIHPVAPFLEVWAVTDAGDLEPLTLDLLKAAGAAPCDLSWQVHVGNIKAFRRTGDPHDRIEATAGPFSDHAVQELLGRCENFKPDHVLPLGSVQYVKPTEQFPEVRLRFTPAEGKVYGPSVDDNVPPGQDVYDATRGKWKGYADHGAPTDTVPGSIYAGDEDKDGNWVSRGYLDDECDGLVEVRLTVAGKTLSAFARIGAGPPAFAPDSFPPRTVADELEQALLGPVVQQPDVPSAEAEEIVRRAFETVRLMNTAVMNGNFWDDRIDVASTMVRQDTGDTGRLFEPIMAPSLVDTLAVLALHQSVFTALRSGMAPWFPDVLRRYDEIGDLSSVGRRKMPALMRGADGRYMALTRRQVDAVEKTARRQLFEDRGPDQERSDRDSTHGIIPKNLTAQLRHRAAGNPPGTLPESAISNCYPGLEFDFRNVWKRIFVGIELHEADNYVVKAEDPQYQGLVGHRLLRVIYEISGDGGPREIKDALITQVTGPQSPNGPSIALTSGQNPFGVAPLEWSNALAIMLKEKAGQKVRCEFTAEPSVQPRPLPEVDGGKTVVVDLEVRRFFEPGQAVVSRGMVEPGELTQSLCSPWQNDYRECACYYWAASRPDYVNLVPTGDGTSAGNNWMQKDRGPETPRHYILDDRADTRLVTYDELFQKWEEMLHFEIGGKDRE